MKHITQSEQWARFRESTPNVKKVLEVDGHYIYIHKIPFLPFTIAYAPRADIKIDANLKNLLKKENAIYLKVEPVNGISNFKFQISNSILPQHTIYIDLTESEEDLLKEMHEKTRYNIRLAQKKGVTVRENDDIETFIKILEMTESRQNFYSHNPGYYRKLFDMLNPVILTAYVDGTPAAAIMLFNYDGVLYYPYGGSDPKYKEYMSPNLLHWEAIKLGKKLGCKIYDLWGSYKYTKDESDPWYGIYRFKSGFGGREVDFPQAIDIPLSPLYPLFTLVDNIRWFLLKHGSAAK